MRILFVLSCVLLVSSCNICHKKSQTTAIHPEAWVGTWQQCDANSWNSESFSTHQPQVAGFAMTLTQMDNNIFNITTMSNGQLHRKGLGAVTEGGTLWLIEKSNDVIYRCHLKNKKLHCIGLESGEKGWVATTTLCQNTQPS